jgi:hypothetical protein
LLVETEDRRRMLIDRTEVLTVLGKPGHKTAGKTPPPAGGPDHPRENEA